MRADKLYPSGFVILDGKRFVDADRATQYLVSIGYTEREAHQYLKALEEEG